MVDFKVILLVGVMLAIWEAHGFPQPTSIGVSLRESNQPLIVRGRPAKQGELPYQLSLRFSGSHLCGASLIQVQEQLLALTAAHCVSEFNHGNLNNLTVVAGEVNLKDTSEWEQTRQVVKIIVHKKYNEYTLTHDIALLHLDHPFKLNENVKIIDLPKQSEETEGQLVVSGWGRLYTDGPSPNQLQVVNLTVVDHDTCQAKWFPFIIGKYVICAGAKYKGVCNGDSGGPAKSTLGHLAGIVSFGSRKGCADPKKPSGFTKVAYFIDWINANV